jgi:uncharacterized protein (TIGR03083 family)
MFLRRRNFSEEVAMPLSRTEVLQGHIEELGRFESLLRSLDQAEWSRPTRCEGWTVGDVAAHVVGTLRDIGDGRLEGLTTPERQIEMIETRRGRSPAELADELHDVIKVVADIAAGFDDAAWTAPAPAGLAPSLGEGVEALWYDAYVHGDDIRAATSRPSVGGPGLRASVSHLSDLLTGNGWGPATLALDGTGEFPVSGGGGARITGDPLAFVLVATGRRDPSTIGLSRDVNVYA